MNYMGDFLEDATVYITFNTFDSNDPSASVTITDLVSSDVEIWKNGVVQTTPGAGVTITLNIGTNNGTHLIVVDTSNTTDGGFYVISADYQVRINGTTIDGATVNAWVGSFSIENRFKDVNVVSEDNIDFGALKKTSLNAATTDLSAITGDKASYKATGYAVANDVTTAHSTTDAKIDTTDSLIGGLNNFDASATPVEIRATGGTAGKNAAELVDDICDEDISKAQHNVANSLAVKIRHLEHVLVVEEGTARGDGGGNNTIELAAGASANDNWYRYDWIILVENTGVGQLRHVKSSDGTTKICVLDGDWITNPAAGTDYIIIARSSVDVDELEDSAVDGIFDEEVDNDGTAITLRGFCKLVLSVLVGKSSGGGGATVVFRDINDSKNRISATVDANGNRTAVGTRDAS